MEELLELRRSLLAGDLTSALLIVDELEEMSKDDKINNIRSYAKVLLLHLIKQQVENLTTKTWEVSIRNSVLEIKEKNKRRKSGGKYLTHDELFELLESALNSAINSASLDVAQGKYESFELEELIDKQLLLNNAIALLA